MNKKVITATLVLSLLASTPSFAAPFTDVNDPNVDYVYENGLMSGMSATKFQPNTTLTRGQFATVFASLTGGETPSGSLPFVDVKPTAYYYAPVLWAYNNNIVSGTTSNTFSPNATLNREQVASMVGDYLKKYPQDVIELKPTTFADLNQASPWARDGVQLAGQVFKFAGIITSSNFEPKKPFTRLEVARLVSSLSLLRTSSIFPGRPSS